MICIAVSVVKLNACGALMEKMGLKGDIWATRILVQNGRYLNQDMCRFCAYTSKTIECMKGNGRTQCS